MHKNMSSLFGNILKWGSPVLKLKNSSGCYPNTVNKLNKGKTKEIHRLHGFLNQNLS
jgi:hypothetical protein